jgi:hypothetical protein
MSLMNRKGNLSRPVERGEATEATGYAADLVGATRQRYTEPTRYGRLDRKARAPQGRGQVGAAKGTGQLGAASGQRTCRRIASSVRCGSAGTHVTCFTGTKSTKTDAEGAGRQERKLARAHDEERVWMDAGGGGSRRLPVAAPRKSGSASILIDVDGAMLVLAGGRAALRQTEGA